MMLLNIDCAMEATHFALHPLFVYAEENDYFPLSMQSTVKRSIVHTILVLHGVDARFNDDCYVKEPAEELAKSHPSEYCWCVEKRV